ncbi:hypothetical protein AAZX31_17G244200 [Glycine max]|uniref:uncharacterized protein LOC114393231 isoform X2 n=1 Tax=Glycine soja TaxID=3848 RepID=UPI00103EE66A|nr:uncharacterized protein LOC114393231 isoform X2 [Glycine soja]
MDKAPTKVRRGSSAFSNANKRRHKHKLFVLSRGDLRFSKKEKVRSLSAVGTPSSTFQMACINVSEQQTHEPSSTVIATTNRFKLHKNFLNNCNGASVPRKLRSVTKKRGRESMLLDSEKLKHTMHGIESLKKESLKKSKVSVKQGMWRDCSPREGASGPITKDEQEVAETLYALAGMFPHNASNHNSTDLDGKFLPDNSSVLQDLEDNASAAALQDSILASATAPVASPSYHESSAGEASKISWLNEAVGQKQPDLPESATLLMPSHSTSLTINLQTMPVAAKRENSNKVALHDSELCLAMGLNMPKLSRISQVERKTDVAFEAVRDVDCKQQQHLIKEQKGNGLALWPGLSPVAPAGQAYLQSSATKAPDWLEAAIRASKMDSMETSTCSSRGSIFIPKRSWKKCAAHVHISHIIKSLEVPKTQVFKETEFFECHQMREHEGPKRGVLLKVHSSNEMKNGITSTVRNPHESKNIILRQQCHYRNISQAAPTPVVQYGHQKQQNFNFLSLSAGSNGLKLENNYNKIGSMLEPLSKLQVPYLQSLAPLHGGIPIPAVQRQYASTSYLDQLSVAGPEVRLQQPRYFGNPLYGTHYGSTVSHKQQEHQSFWGVQQAEQGRSTVNFNILRTQYPNWQSGRHDSSALSPCAQAILPCSPASQEIFGSKITSISGQQKQLLAPFQDKWTRPSSSPFIM